jgi:Fe-S-cluster containining protein
MKVWLIDVNMTCRKCGACCIAPSIETALPGMPDGKPAGVRCANLTADNLCSLFGRPQRPAFCVGWRPAADLCGRGFHEAMRNIAALEGKTARRSQEKAQAT